MGWSIGGMLATACTSPGCNSPACMKVAHFSALGRWVQKDREFKVNLSCAEPGASLGYQGPCLKN